MRRLSGATQNFRGLGAALYTPSTINFVSGKTLKYGSIRSGRARRLMVVKRDFLKHDFGAWKLFVIGHVILNLEPFVRAQLTSRPVVT